MSVTKRPDGRWRARYRGPDGRERAKHFDRKVDAERWLTEQRSKLNRGEWLDPGLSRLTLGEWASQWLEGQAHLKPSTRDRYKRILEVQILPRWERVRLACITHADVVGWLACLSADGYAPATVRQVHRVLSLMLGLAVRDGRLVRNVADGVRLPRVRRDEPTFLSHAQVDQLADACGDYGLLIRTLAYTGLRWGEVTAITVRRLDLLRRRIEVAEAVTDVGGELVFGTPKSHQRRSVPLPRSLVEPLAEHVAGKGPNELVFTSPTGGVLRNHNFRRRVFAPAAALVGLVDLTPHDLRHTAASLAVQAGANVKAVQRMLGHASAAMTLDVYAGLFADDLDAVADRLDEAANRARADSLRTAGEVRPLRGGRSGLTEAR